MVCTCFIMVTTTLCAYDEAEEEEKKRIKKFSISKKNTQ